MDVAIPCGLILTELITNAFKYAFPQGRSGTIDLLLSAVGTADIELIVTDDGVGLPEGHESPDHGSMGLALVRLLVEQLDGKLEISRGKGTEFRISFSDGCEP